MGEIFEQNLTVTGKFITSLSRRGAELNQVKHGVVGCITLLRVTNY